MQKQNFEVVIFETKDYLENFFSSGYKIKSKNKIMHLNVKS